MIQSFRKPCLYHVIDSKEPVLTQIRKVMTIPVIEGCVIHLTDDVACPYDERFDIFTTLLKNQTTYPVRVKYVNVICDHLLSSGELLSEKLNKYHFNYAFSYQRSSYIKYKIYDTQNLCELKVAKQTIEMIYREFHYEGIGLFYSEADYLREKLSLDTISRLSEDGFIERINFSDELLDYYSWLFLPIMKVIIILFYSFYKKYVEIYEKNISTYSNLSQGDLTFYGTFSMLFKTTELSRTKKIKELNNRMYIDLSKYCAYRGQKNILLNLERMVIEMQSRTHLILIRMILHYANKPKYPVSSIHKIIHNLDIVYSIASFLLESAELERLAKGD